LCLIHFCHPGPVYLKSSLQTFPYVVHGFMGKDLERIDERIRPFSADDELLRVYEDISGNRIELYIGYFTVQTRDKKIIDYRRGWMHQLSDLVPVKNGRNTVMINNTPLRDGVTPDAVYFWYFMNGRIITDQLAGKFATFWDGLLKRKTNGAVVIIQTKNAENIAIPFIRDIMPLIHNHLSDT
jgi:EpsI family protein